MRAYRRLLIFGVLTLSWMAATIIVQGGWQAASAAFAIAAGGGFALTFASIGVASERPRSRHPSWAHASDRPRHGIAAEPPAHSAAAPAPIGSQQATSGRRTLAPRPARTV
jgi:hypothetical protein